jgi:hypothetical protein
MSLRLGEVLIDKGLIDERQLEIALHAQLVYGGHLGTCLVELGFIDVDALGQTLSQAFKVNHAHQEMIAKPSPQIISLLPKKLVERHQAIPFQLNDGTLHVAMIDPRNLLALDELSFASGHKIEAWVAPEIVIVHAMERHYGVSRKLRYISLSDDPLRALEQATNEALPAAESPQLGPPAAPPETVVEETRESRDVFVAQPVPGYRQRERTGGADDRTLTVDWIKVRKEGREPEAWSHLFDVDLTHEHFESAEGVYVVWHHGRNPVLRVGQGVIREELQTLQTTRNLVEAGQNTVLYVTWARIDRDRRDGVERYLAEMLDPEMCDRSPETDPIEVNLPR